VRRRGGFEFERLRFCQPAPSARAAAARRRAKAEPRGFHAGEPVEVAAGGAGGDAQAHRVLAYAGGAARGRRLEHEGRKAAHHVPTPNRRHVPAETKTRKAQSSADSSITGILSLLREALLKAS